MKAYALVLCLAGGAAAYYPEPAYNVGPAEPAWGGGSGGYLSEPSQRLFWGNSATGTNQVGGTGLWAHFTNKFPFLATMFGRLEQPAPVYGPPAYQPQSNYVPQYYSEQSYPHLSYQQPSYQQPSYQQGYPAVGRGVAFTDDAVVITPPEPAPEPEPGYHYAPPQQRFQLPQK